MLLNSTDGSVPHKSDTRAMFAFLFCIVNAATATQRFYKSGPATATSVCRIQLRQTQSLVLTRV